MNAGVRAIREREIAKLERLNCLLIFGGIASDSLMQAAFYAARHQGGVPAIHMFIGKLIEASEEHGLSGAVFNRFLTKLLLNDENIFSRLAECKLSIGESLRQAVLHDLQIILEVFGMDWSKVFEQEAAYPVVELITNYHPSRVDITSESEVGCGIIKAKSSDEFLETLYRTYGEQGYGIIRNNRMLRLLADGSLQGIKNQDPITFDDLIGCDIQKETLIRNTEGFLNGQPANNVLLIGARGSGKSSCVKALVNAYYSDGLRLVEVNRDQITEIYSLMEKLMNRGKKFIIFIDDLSFDESETQYKFLKSVLEGGIVKKPDNVLFYATSNRRHIIQEKFSDRDGPMDNHMNDEVHGSDTVNEKISLSDRFGINIVFPSPNQTQYLEILRGIAKHRGLTLLEEDIKAAVAWELNQKGRSGRAARQFVDDLLLRQSKITVADIH